jgi:hypothetical protein
VSEDLHKLALQLSRISQQYEKYWQEAEVLANRYEGLPTQVQAVIGVDMMTDEIIAMLHNVTVAHEGHVSTIRRCRSVLLQVAQHIVEGNY